MSQLDDRSYAPRIHHESGCGKFLLVLLAVAGFGTIMLCCGGALFLYWGFQQLNLTREPDKVRQVASEMLDISIPDVYLPAMAMNIKQVDFAIAGFTDEKNNRGIILIKYPLVGVSPQQNSAVKRARGDRDFSVEKSEEKTFTLRNREVKFLVQEGKDKNGNSMRQFSGNIKGRTGMVELFLMGAREHVTDEEFQKLLNTIKGQDDESEQDPQHNPDENLLAPPLQPTPSVPATNPQSPKNTTEDSDSPVDNSAEKSETETSVTPN